MIAEAIPIDLNMINHGLRAAIRQPYEAVYCATSPRMLRLTVVHDENYVTSWEIDHHIDMPSRVFVIPQHIVSMLISDAVMGIDQLGLAVDDDRVRLLFEEPGEPQAELTWRADSQSTNLPENLMKMVSRPMRFVQIPFQELDEVLGEAMDELTRLVEFGSDPPLIVAIDFAPLRLSVAGHDMTVLDLKRRYYDLRRFVNSMELLTSDAVTVAIEDEGDQALLILDAKQPGWRVQCTLYSVEDAQGKLTYTSRDELELQGGRTLVQTPVSGSNNSHSMHGKSLEDSK
jgi:hypothetical protein